MKLLLFIPASLFALSAFTQVRVQQRARTVAPARETVRQRDTTPAPLIRRDAAVIANTEAIAKIDTTPKIRKTNIYIKQTIPKVSRMRVIKGQIRDAQGQPLAGISITVKGKPVGVMTDQDGRFSLSVDEAEKIVISNMGFSSVEMNVENSNFSANGFTVKSQLSQVSKEVSETTVSSLQVFPLPYPLPSTSYLLPSGIFSSARVLKDADSIIQQGLSACSYDVRKYFYIPHGFALVTQMEQIYNDGRSMPPPDRWSSSIGELNDPWDYIKALFSSPVGYYRVLVFLVTDVDHNAGQDFMSEDEAKKWLNNGYNALPKDIKYKPMTTDHTVTLLVYHYKKNPGETGTQILPDEITGMEHYTKSRLKVYIK